LLAGYPFSLLLLDCVSGQIEPHGQMTCLAGQVEKGPFHADRRGRTGGKGDMTEPTKEELAKGKDSCLDGFKELPGSIADDAATCILQQKELKDISACMEAAAKAANQK
jgi:hypothetical protein